MMSAEESATAVATSSTNPTPPITSTADLASMLQQIQAAQAAQQVPVVTTAAPPNPLLNLETLLSTASLANLAAGGALNPLSMLALTSSLNQSSPVYQGIARVLLTMNMGQMLATHQTSELLATMNQQESLMALIAARSGLAFPFPQPNQQQQQQQPQAPSQSGFAIPQVLPHMSLKRGNKEQLNVGGSDRKKSCPPMAMVSNQVQHQPPPQPVITSVPPPRSPSPPRKSMFENLPPEMKEKNEMFRKEILRRLDIILLEELGAEDEEEVEKKPDTKQVSSSEEDTDDSSKDSDSMGAEGSAFRRILSRSSTMGNNSTSPSASRTTTPSTTGSLSSGPDSPPLGSDPLSSAFLSMLESAARKNREDRGSEALSAKIVDEAAFMQHFPMVWTGRLSLKSSETNINLHLINGSETFLNDVLGRQLNDENPRRNSMKIHQRLRLDNGQVEHVYGILTSPDYACCLALSSTTDFNEEQMRINEGNLKASFIDYLIKKQIAGVSNLDEVETKLKSARVHVFAPGEMVNKYLSELASSLHEYLNNTSTRYLLIVFTNDKIEPNMEGPPSIESLAVPTLSSS